MNAQPYGGNIAFECPIGGVTSQLDEYYIADYTSLTCILQAAGCTKCGIP
jgi:hypothetical protein